MNFVQCILDMHLAGEEIDLTKPGEIGCETRRYANKIMMDSNLCLVMVEGDDLALIEARPAAMSSILLQVAASLEKYANILTVIGSI